MSERYLITGVQIGLLKSGIDTKKILKEIEDSQFIGHSGDPVSFDADMIFNSRRFAPSKEKIKSSGMTGARR
jgi:hypothetical protein